jgi:hypothetical protein
MHRHASTQFYSRYNYRTPEIEKKNDFTLLQATEKLLIKHIVTFIIRNGMG